MKSTLKVGFLTSSDPTDQASWSGIHFRMIQALEHYFGQVTPLGPVSVSKRRHLLLKGLNIASRIFLSGGYNLIHNNILAAYYASVFTKKLQDADYDLIFAPTSSVEIANVETDIPIFYFSDTSFSQLKNYYTIFSNLSQLSQRESDQIQKRALKKSHIVIHSSRWASEFVMYHYGIAAQKAFTVPMGANISEAPNLEAIAKRLKSKSVCNLLLMGVEWERKGGPLAFKTFLQLNKMGVNTTLTVCGCLPPKEFSHPQFKVIPFLNKNNEDEYRRFYNVMIDSHFMLVPTRAECAGIVFAEASAFGIPSITTDTGGVGSMVENGINGYRLPLTAEATGYAALIKEIFNDDERYRSMVYSSRSKYDNELNWKTWGGSVRDIILSHTPSTTSGSH